MTNLTDIERAAATEIAGELRTTPAFAFASAFLARNPPAEAPPSPHGGDWTAIEWFADVARTRFGADISVTVWALALEEAGVEIRVHRGRAEARMSEVAVLDMIDHRATEAEKAIVRRFQIFSGGTGSLQ